MMHATPRQQECSTAEYFPFKLSGMSDIKTKSSPYTEPVSEADALERRRLLQIKLETKDGSTLAQKRAILDEQRFLKAWVAQFHAADFEKNKEREAELATLRADNVRLAAENESLRQELARLRR